MTSETDALHARVRALRPLGEAVCAALTREARTLGLGAEQVAIPSFDSGRFELRRDTGSGEYSLLCVWVDDRGQRQGSALFHPDGSFWAEYDVVRPHPAKPHWFVEAVTAWGRGDEIKAEPRLLPALS